MATDDTTIAEISRASVAGFWWPLGEGVGDMCRGEEAADGEEEGGGERLGVGVGVDDGVGVGDAEGTGA